ncbi:MAG: hypothetical protein K9J12_00860 [Melioribacteraceae bacterium]|nr:hypothetical protein [Melioribacteraceae bacterium]MCF8266408.1 hypothetical protein [Melioribacteraceae bacterium]MCF8413386.1 hypothetical protein [Melioribacteraceae bacterium]
MNINRLLTIIGLLLFAAITRLLPHPPNFAPITAIALFGGVYLSNKKLAFLLPIGVLFITDLILGFHQTMLFVYAGFAIIVGIGFLLKTKKNSLTIILASFAGSTIFFVITNFAVWALGTYYPKSIDGLMASYVAAIPFFQNAIIGDLVFSGLFFGGFALLEKYVPAIREEFVK